MSTYKAYCDWCEQVVKLTEDGYCGQCGKHADNMPSVKRMRMESSLEEMRTFGEIEDAEGVEYSGDYPG